jgi:hypothetical protein
MDYRDLTAVANEDEEEEDDNHDMEDEAPPATEKLEAVISDNYDEDAAVAAAM